MSLVMPEAAAISSIEVAAYPLRAKAAAAPRRIAAWRSARGRGPEGGATGSAVRAGIGIRRSIPWPVYRTRGDPSGVVMSNLQTSWTETELLADEPVVEPLMVAGYRCHGGFDGDGRYHSPRTRFRVPAIAAWQAAHREQFGTELLDVPLDTWPQTFPSVAQSRYLLELGVREPTISALTRIGTVEGFGAMIRH